MTSTTTTRKRLHSPSPDFDSYHAREAPLAKRFRTLSLRGQPSNRISKPQSPRASRSPSPAPGRGRSTHRHATLDNQFMEIDDTPSKVYVYNLSSSDSDSDAEEAPLRFIPDIEKRFTRVPLHFLQPDSPSRGTSTDLVLYREPSSITVGEEEDGVRRFVSEARERMRLRQEQERLAKEREEDERRFEELDDEDEEMVDGDAMDLG